MLTFEKRPAALNQMNEGDLENILTSALRVYLTQDAEGWFAQSVDIDHFAAGATEAEVIENYLHSLSLTICGHLDKWQTIDRMMIPAPATVAIQAKTWGKAFELHGVFVAKMTPTPEQKAAKDKDAVKKLIDSVFDKVPSVVFCKPGRGLVGAGA